MGSTIICILVFLAILVWRLAKWMLRSVKAGGNSFLNLLARKNPACAARIRDAIYVISEWGKIILAGIIIICVLCAIFG